jgi:hypothetical protein
MPAPYGNLPTNEGHVYQTVNGLRTVANMRAELKAAGWPDWERADETAVVNTYARTTRSPVKLAQAPLPYQINPMTWDSLSDTARQLFLSMAELGQTPSGAWTKADYLNQFEQSRPKGIAPKQVHFDYGLNQSYF